LFTGGQGKASEGGYRYYVYDLLDWLMAKGPDE